MSTRILRSHAQDKSSFTTALELCAIENPKLNITDEGGSIYRSKKWPQVQIEHVVELEDLTYQNIINAFEPLLTQPFNYDPTKIEAWKERALEQAHVEDESTFVLYCEHWLIPMLRLIFHGIGYTYKIDLAIGDNGDQAGEVPVFRTWPGTINKEAKRPDFGSIYNIKEGKSTRIWIAVADAKLAVRWTWEDRHRRRKDLGLQKFLYPCRQLAAYGVEAGTQYAIAVTPEEACFTCLIDQGKASKPTSECPLSLKQIGVQGAAVKWSVSGKNRVTVLLGMVAWILSAMNEDYRPIVSPGAQTRLDEWVAIQEGNETLYFNKISQRTLRELPHGAIVLS